MITIGMNYNVLPGKETIFENACEGVIRALQAAAGHTKSYLYRDVKNVSSYLIISEWQDKPAFDAFIQSEQFRSVANWGKEQILAGRPSHTVYTTQG